MKHPQRKDKSIPIPPFRALTIDELRHMIFLSLRHKKFAIHPRCGLIRRVPHDMHCAKVLPSNGVVKKLEYEGIKAVYQACQGPETVELLDEPGVGQILVTKWTGINYKRIIGRLSRLDCVTELDVLNIIQKLLEIA